MKQYRMGVVKEVRQYYSISCLCEKDVISTGRINLDYLRAEDERNRQLELTWEMEVEGLME